MSNSIVLTTTIDKLNIINADINVLRNAERITKKVLGELSRNLLDYVMVDAGVNANGKQRELGDIDAINRTIQALTPMNKQVAIMYFREFLPYSYNENTCEFGKLNKKKRSAKLEQIKAWLEDNNNNIWTWSEDNIDVAKKPVDLGADITKAVQRAVKGTEETRSKEATGPLSVAAILDAVIAGGVDPMGLVNMLAQASEKAA